MCAFFKNPATGSEWQNAGAWCLRFGYVGEVGASSKRNARQWMCDHGFPGEALQQRLQIRAYLVQLRRGVFQSDGIDAVKTGEVAIRHQRLDGGSSVKATAT